MKITNPSLYSLGAHNNKFAVLHFFCEANIGNIEG